MIQIYIIALTSMLVLDLIWISINHKTYSKLVERVQKQKPNYNKIYAILAYIVMCISIVFIMIPNIYNDPNKSVVILSIKHGALLGFVIYSIFNLTNLAIFTNYDVNTAIIDTIWGTVLYTTIASICVSFMSK